MRNDRPRDRCQFNIGGGEFLFILVIALIVFGAGRLPEVLGQLGKGVRTFRDEASSEAARPTASSGTPATCDSCQATLPAGAKFCPKCGKAA